MDILTRPLGTQEMGKFVFFCLMNVLWIFMIIVIAIVAVKTESMKALVALPGISAVQLLMTYSYTDYRVASVKKELLKEQEEIKFTLKAMEQAKQENKFHK